MVCADYLHGHAVVCADYLTVYTTTSANEVLSQDVVWNVCGSHINSQEVASMQDSIF